MRRIKQLEERITCVEDINRLLAGDITFLEAKYVELQGKFSDIYNSMRANNESLIDTMKRHTDYAERELKELDEKISATKVRIGRLENPPKFKEGDVVEEAPMFYETLTSFYNGVPPRKLKVGTVVSWYYKQHGDVFVTYKIFTEDKKDVFELPENLLKLSAPKTGENKKNKK